MYVNLLVLSKGNSGLFRRLTWYPLGSVIRTQNSILRLSFTIQS